MKKLIISFLIFGLVGVANAKTPKAKVKINGKELNISEYRTLKTNRINGIRNMKTVPLSQNEVREWIDIANIELQGCPIRNISSQNVVEKINQLIETGC